MYVFMMLGVMVVGAPVALGIVWAVMSNMFD